ncbi:hypothetical protein [Methanosarcina barkeri]|nr:hypothetical protein [Methanosarcina barkeri]
MTNDIFYKMIMIFSLQAGFITFPLMTKLVNKDNFSLYAEYLFIFSVVGFISLFVFFVILRNVVECKIALRKQSESIETEIRNLYLSNLANQDNYFNIVSINNPDSYCKFKNKYCKFKITYYINKCANNSPLEDKCYQYWERVKRRGWLKILNGKTDEERFIILLPALILMIIWTAICFYLILDPDNTLSLFNFSKQDLI